MNLAFHEMFSVTDGFANSNVSGRTDLYILSEGLRQHGIAGGHEAHLEKVLERYYGHLKRTLGERKGYLMPGFPQLLEELSQRDGVRIGLATGNFSEAAWMKMVRLGLERFADGRAPEDILIIGDTPHDVSCALDNGLVAVGVATGNYTVDQLRDCGAHLAFENFADWQGAAAKLAGEA